MNAASQPYSQLDLVAERDSGHGHESFYEAAARVSEAFGVEPVPLEFAHVGQAANSLHKTEAEELLEDASRIVESGETLGPAACNRLGQLAAMIDQLERAAEWFRRATDALSNDAEKKLVLQNLLVVELERREFDAAREVVAALANLRPPADTAVVVWPPAKLEIRAGPLRGEQFEIASPESILGRGVPQSAGSSDCRIESPMVSRRHALLRYEDGSWTIEDLGSVGGTFVNERRVEGRAPLADGDCIRLANVELWFLFPAASEAASSIVEVSPERDEPSAGIGEQPDESPAPPYVDENVQFTVYRPRSVVPEKWYPLLAFAHLSDKPPETDDDEPDPVEQVQRQAAAILGDRAEDYQDVTQDAAQAVPRAGVLTMVPEITGVEFNPPRRTFTWEESVHREEFRLKAGRELVGKPARGRLTVFFGSIILAEVPLAIRVTETEEPRTEQKLEPQSARPYRKIFASYSHRDLPIVEQFEQYIEMLGDQYLRDWKHLRSGQVWNDRLMEMIREADVFQLFWSRNSMHSPYVRQEWEYALSLGRPHFVRPTYWEDPLPAAPEENLPPESLLRLHFQRLGAANVATAAPKGSPPVAREPQDERQLKRQLAGQLIDKLDMERIGEMSPETVRSEVRKAAEFLLDRESPLLSRRDRERLIEECLDESFGHPPRPEEAPASTPPPPAAEKRGEKQGLKERLAKKLIGNMDLGKAGELSQQTMRRELRAAAEHIMDQEDAGLSRSERDQVIEACLNDIFGRARPPQDTATAPERSGDLAMRGGEEEPATTGTWRDDPGDRLRSEVRPPPAYPGAPPPARPSAPAEYPDAQPPSSRPSIPIWALLLAAFLAGALLVLIFMNWLW